MSDSIMTFVFTPNKIDYIKAIQSNYFRQKSIWFSLVVLVILGLWNIWAIFIRGMDFNIGVLLPFIILLFSMVSIFFWHPYSLGRQVESNERLKCETRWILSEEEIFISTPYTKVKYDWGTFVDFIEIKDYFLVLHSVNQRMFQIVPKRAFQSSEQMQAFREILIRKIRIVNADLKQSYWYVKYRTSIIIVSIIFGTIILLMIVLVIINFLTAMPK